MNTEKLIKALTAAILSEPILKPENIERLIRSHVTIESQRTLRQRKRITEKKNVETLSEVIDLRYTLKLERDLAREELSKWKLKVQEILRKPGNFTPESYSKISNRIKNTMGKVKEQKIRDAGQNIHRLKSSRAQEIKLSRKINNIPTADHSKNLVFKEFFEEKNTKI
ncbi:MAG TPA: hypothetical protein PKA53_02105 [Sphingobacterium sp.]|nr:hypothetical protein [Sphingobacterium sp.]